jgi:predicted RNA-binding protein with EMAP domain
MRRATPESLHDRQQGLIATLEETQGELARLGREQEYLETQIRQAEEQVRYYEDLLTLLRRDWGKPPGLQDFVRRL